MAIAMMVPFESSAQNGMEDVIYLNDGSIYRGIIIEQVPNTSYKIRSRDGNVYVVKAEEVEKITKEDLPQQYGHWGHGWRRDTVAYDHHRRGYFNELQLLIENVQGGVRFVNGYRFGPYGQLGIGIGMDRVFSNPFNPYINDLEKKELAGVYMPLYLYYAGDGPMRKRITPYYAMEAGYAMAFKGWGDQDRNVDDYGNRLYGGPIAGLGMGFKFHPRRHRGHFSLLFNVNYKRVKYDRDVFYLNTTGQIIGFATQTNFAHLIIPGIRLGIGF